MCARQVESLAMEASSCPQCIRYLFTEINQGKHCYQSARTVNSPFKGSGAQLPQSNRLHSSGERQPVAG